MPRDSSRRSSRARPSPSDVGEQVRQFGRDRRRERSQLERQGHQPLLRAVVQIPLDPSVGFVAGRHDTSAGGDQLGAALRVRDGGGDELSERDALYCFR
jgi:hypothetical protein